MSEFLRVTQQRTGHDVPTSRRRPLFPALATLLFICLAFLCASQAPVRPSLNASGAAPAAQEQKKVDGQAADAVQAAKAFLNSLDDKLRAQAVFEYGSPKKSNWSNLPVTSVPRNGVRLGDMTPAQREAAHQLLRAVLSKEGYQKVIDIMGSDEDLRINSKGGKGGGKGGLGFGKDNYFLAIFGTPSNDQPWFLQFGGHHLGVNLTMVGKTAILTPTHTGVQPASYTENNRTVRALGGETDKAFKLVNALDEKQQAQAILKQKVTNLILGPGQDGKTIPPDGIKASSLTADQQGMLLDLIGEWVKIVDPDTASARMAEIKGKLADTYFAWSGPTKEGSVVYYRVQGPTLVIEFAHQGNTGHIHTIIRNPTDDYGKQSAMR